MRKKTLRKENQRLNAVNDLLTTRNRTLIERVTTLEKQLEAFIPRPPLQEEEEVDEPSTVRVPLRNVPIHGPSDPTSLTWE
jgi:hypothetical protein